MDQHLAMGLHLATHTDVQQQTYVFSQVSQATFFQLNYPYEDQHVD